MLLTLHAATRFLALSACLVFFVQCVCVIEFSVLPPAPLRHLPRRGNARPGAAASFGACSRLRASEFTAPARVSLACLYMHADFVRPANRVMEHKVLCVCVFGSCFLCALVYFCSGGTCWLGQTSATPSLHGGDGQNPTKSPVPLRGVLHARTRTHWVMSACDLFPW